MRPFNPRFPMSDQPASAPVSAPTPALSPAGRAVRAVLVTVLSLAISFLGLLALVATTPLVRDTIKPLVSDHEVISIVAALTVLTAVIAIPLFILGRLTRRGVFRLPHLAGLTAVVAASFGYLAWDDPVVRRPLTMDEMAPMLPGDEVTHALVLRYGKNTIAAKAYTPPKDPIVARVGPKEGEKWAEHLRKNQAAIEAGWDGLVHVRAWWDELAQQPRLGDATPPRFDAMILAFQPVRAYSQHASAIAGLKALDGKGDEAADMMIRLYDVARKLEPHSRTLVRTMIAKVIQRMAIETSVFILDRGNVSPEKRAALARTLAAATAGPAGARRLVLTEYPYVQPMLTQYVRSNPDPFVLEDKKWMHAIIRRCSVLLVNPHATHNLMGDRYYALAALAEERRFKDFEASAQAIDRSMGGYRIKNLGGRMIADMAMPAMSKVVKSYWDIEDQRVALLARLKA
jgi:hypothetical protein